MSTTFPRTTRRIMSLLLPPEVREWLPTGLHLAHHVSDLVDGLDLTAFYALYEGDGRRNGVAVCLGRRAVKVLLYAYATGVFERRAGTRGSCFWTWRSGRLAAGNFPQRRTHPCLSFGVDHLADFQALFVEVVRLAQELGLRALWDRCR